MKILLLSDSHGRTENIEPVLERLSGHVGAVIHLGDGAADISRFSQIYPELKFYSVAGNCDSHGEGRLLLHVEGKTILAVHGHKQYVKSGYERLIGFAEELSADVCLFGHTHTPDIFRFGETLFINPGSISFPHHPNPPTYGVLDIGAYGINAGIVEIYSKNKFRSWSGG